MLMHAHSGQMFRRIRGLNANGLSFESTEPFFLSKMKLTAPDNRITIIFKSHFFMLNLFQKSLKIDLPSKL